MSEEKTVHVLIRDFFGVVALARATTPKKSRINTCTVFSSLMGHYSRVNWGYQFTGGVLKNIIAFPVFIIRI